MHGDKREKEYLEEYVSSLIKNLYGLEPIIKEGKKDNSFGLFYNNKCLVKQKISFGLPNGKKENIVIPPFVYNSNYVFHCIRGIFDTDGCLQFKNRNKFAKPYQSLDITSKSDLLINQISNKLKFIGITYSIHKIKIPHYKTRSICETSRIFIFGVSNLNKWVEFIGFSNPKNIKKYNDWKALGGN